MRCQSTQRATTNQTGQSAESPLPTMRRPSRVRASRCRGCPASQLTHCQTDIADGGAGIICTGNIPIHRDYLENAYNAVLDPSNTWNAVQAFTPAIRAAKSRGALLLAQLQFPGRQCPININPNPKAPSDIQLQPCFNKIYGKPTALTIEEIKDLQRRYVWAAQQLAKAGADGVIVSRLHSDLTIPEILT